MTKYHNSGIYYAKLLLIIPKVISFLVDILSQIRTGVQHKFSNFLLTNALQIGLRWSIFSNMKAAIFFIGYIYM